METNKTNQRSHKSLFRFFADAIVMFLSVLFALFINEWRQEYNSNQETSILIENLDTELLRNEKVIQYYSKYHKEVADRLDSIHKNKLHTQALFPEGNLEYYHLAENGIIQHEIDVIAWEVALQQNLSNRISYKRAAGYKKLYMQCDVINETIMMLGSELSTREIYQIENAETSILMLRDLFQELAGQEQYFLNQLKRFKDKYEVSPTSAEG